MNAAQWTVPAGNPHAADAVGAIGSGDHLFTGSGDEGNTFGTATQISATQILTALHVMPFQSAGYHSLPVDHSATARVYRARRLLNGTAPGGGVHANYYNVSISGYRVPVAGGDIALCDLAAPIAHIAPMAVDDGSPAVNDDLVLPGWGLDGAVLNAGAYPYDARYILGRKLSSRILDPFGYVKSINWDGVDPGPNLYDSGHPVVRLVGGVWKLCGVQHTAIEQFRNDPTFQIPGLTPQPPTAPPPDPTTWLRSADNVLDNGAPGTPAPNFDPIQIKWRIFKGTFINKTIFLAFDVSSLAGPITGATLRMYVGQGGVAANMTPRFRRIRRPVNAGVTWNTYDGVNAWATPGGEDVNLDVFNANEFTLAATAAQLEFEEFVVNHANLLAMVQAARAEGAPLRLLIESPAADGGSAQWHSNAYVNPVWRPRLEVQIPAPPISGVKLHSGICI